MSESKSTSAPGVQCRERRRMRLSASLLAVASIATVFLSCASAAREANKEAPKDYLQAVRQLESNDAVLEPGSDAERRAIERFQHALSDFKAPDLRDRIRAAYATEVFFNDTLKTIRGLEAVEAYLVETAHNVEETTFAFLDVVQSEGNYYFRWRMTIRAKRLSGGEALESVGMTHVRFDADGKVVLHKDYWDAAGGLFEHVPVLGWMVRRLKKRL